MASGLALRNLLRRTKATAIIGALQGVTRPENLRMANLLDIQVETDRRRSSSRASTGSRMVDVQPHYFGGLIDRVDLVIDHHPEQTGYSAIFKDIRADYGSTCTILTEHLRAVDANISERTATAMLYAIKSDTLFFNRQANRVDLEAFSYLYPLADATLIRKMEGAEITMERLDYVLKRARSGTAATSRCSARSSATTPREDFIPYVADFFLQLEDVKWTIVAGIVNDSFVMSVRNLGYSRNAGEFVRRYFADIGSAGGHRAMAKAVVPRRPSEDRFGSHGTAARQSAVLDLALQFLHENAGADRDAMSRSSSARAGRRCAPTLRRWRRRWVRRTGGRRPRIPDRSTRSTGRSDPTAHRTFRPDPADQSGCGRAARRRRDRTRDGRRECVTNGRGLLRCQEFAEPRAWVDTPRARPWGRPCRGPR